MVRQQVKDNCRTEQNPDGVLTGRAQDYTDCLELRGQDFEQMLEQDRAHWAESLEVARKIKDEITEQIQSTLERYQQELTTIFSREPSALICKRNYTVKKLPLFGYDAPNNEIDF